MKNFNEIYEKVYRESINNHVEESRQQYLVEKHKHILITIIILGVLTTLTILAELYEFIFIVIFLTVIVSFVTFSSKSKHYSTDYKQKIIAPLVKYYDEHLNFDPLRRIDRSLYNMAEFEHYDNFYANDYIYGHIDGLIPMKMGDVRTEVETTDSDGNTSRYTVFQGLFSAIKIPRNLQNKIKICTDKGKLGKMFDKKNYVQMDSQEFEKYFDIFTTDKILAMRILTSDIMNFMIQFKKDNKVKFEMTIKNDFVYLRIYSKDMFEANFSKEAMDFDTLYTYYKYLDFVCVLNKMIWNVLKDKEV